MEGMAKPNHVKASSTAYDLSFRKLQRRTLVILYLTYGSFYLSRKADSMVKSALHETQHFSMEDLALADTAYLMAYTISLGVSGVAGNYVRSNVLLALGLLGIALTSFLKSRASTPLAFAFCQVLHAIAQSTGWPTCIKLVGAFVTENRGFVMGIWTTCQSLGGILGAVWATSVATSYGWQQAYLYHIPILVLLSLVVVNFIVDEDSIPKAPVGDEEWQPLTKEDTSEEAKPRERSSSFASKQKPPSMREVLKIPGVILIGVAYFHLKFLRYALLMWLPYYYEEGLHFSQATSGYMSSSFELGGFIGTPLIGLLSDRVMRGKRDLTSAWFMGGACVMLTGCIAVSHGNAAINAFFMAIVGILVIGPDSVLSGTIAQDLGSQSPLGNKAIGTLAGLINSVGSFGSIFQSYATAIISEHFGWRVLFSIFVVCAFVTSSILFRVAQDSIKRGSPSPLWLTPARQRLMTTGLVGIGGLFALIAWSHEFGGEKA
mmetsp:Transcript_8780/g.15435  ORF Transcript_8780/g.15435 Transcript_8780/m.15435 type:complete len:489 (+) Transcript_8780:167-1633(+)